MVGDTKVQLEHLVDQAAQLTRAEKVELIQRILRTSPNLDVNAMNAYPATIDFAQQVSTYDAADLAALVMAIAHRIEAYSDGGEGGVDKGKTLNRPTRSEGREEQGTSG